MSVLDLAALGRGAESWGPASLPDDDRRNGSRSFATDDDDGDERVRRFSTRWITIRAVGREEEEEETEEDEGVDDDEVHRA